ncbi:MAG: MFS transporter [Clostridia bacterium]|nr:MFS transporter [Clostridia bacterium]
MQNNTRILKLACYTTNVTMSAVANLSPVLFLTFRTLYGISYSLLGTLVLVVFSTQLIVDLIFSFFSHKFNIEKTVKATPLIAAVGLIFYAVWPYIFPNQIYLGLLIGTVIFASSAGLAEVLISPVIAAIPSKDPDREMSKLHSVYAWGVVGVVIVSTVYIMFAGGKNWQYLPLIFALIPIASFALFLKSKVPEMETPERVSGALKQLKSKKLWLCVAAIFLGGASECTMAQWSSGYIERSLGIDKFWGDIFGVAMFGAMLGLGRTLYAKFGKSVSKILLIGAVGALVCYITAAVSNIALVGLIACAFTGFCTSMLWPGSLIIVQEYFPKAGVFVFAMMAAGGDFGASVGPQLVGIITDAVAQSPSMISFAQSLALSPDQLGMKLGMLVGALFPLIAIFVYLYIHKSSHKNKQTS